MFSAINDAVNSGGTAELKASYIEIYNETITCLLNQKENLKLKEVPKVGFCIVGNEEVPCKRPEDIFQILYTGTNNKTTGGTMQNSRSSRSHTLLTLELKVKSVEGSERLSKLTIVDLAGSEKLKNTGANTPERMKEAQKINQSLTSLGMCITALANGDSFVPFRTSKLTLLLKEPLTGNSKTTLLCAARRDKQLVEDNLNSLSFAVRAKNIKVTVKKNVTLSDKEYQYLIDALKGEVLILRKQVKDGGRDFHKITDPKLLSILTNEESAKEGGEAEGDPQSTTTQGEVQSSTTSTGNAPKKQRPRTSLLDLTEEEIIIKYCELKAKYDNLLDNAGHKIMDLTNRASLKQSSLDPEMLKKMNEQREELEKKLDDLTEEKNKEIDQLKDSNEKLTKEKKNLEEELEVAKGDADGLQSMLDLNTADIENLQEQVSKLEAANDLLTKNSGDFESTLKQKTEAIEKLNSTVQEIEVEKINLSRKLDEQRSNYEKEIAALNEQLRLSQERESKLSKENEEMKEEQAKSSNESKAKDTKILELENQIMTIQNDLEKVNVQVGYKDQTIKSLQDEIDRFKSMENEKISDKALFAEKDKLYNENKKVLEERIAKLHEQNEKASSQIIELTNKSNEEKMQFNEAVEELNKANKSLSDEISSYKGEIEKLKVQFKNDLEKKDKEISEKIKKIEDIENNSIKYLEKEKELNNEMLSLEEKFREKSVQVEKLTIDLNSRAKENEKYQSEISAEQVKSKKLKDDLDAAKADFEKYKKSGEAEKEVTEKMEKKMNELRREQDVLRNTNRKLTQVSRLTLGNPRFEIRVRRNGEETRKVRRRNH